MPPYSIKGWCPAPDRPMRTGDGWLLRLKPLGGHLESGQARAIADISARLGNGRLELTSRGSLQLRGVADERLAQAQAEIAALDLHQQGTLAAVLLAPWLDEGDLARQLAQVLAHHPGLPAKFGLAVDCGPVRLLTGARADLHVERAASGLILRLAGRECGLAVTRTSLPQVLDALLSRFVAEGVKGGRGRMRDWTARLGETETPNPAVQPAPGPFGPRILHALPFGALDADLLGRIAATGPVTLTPWRMVGLNRAVAEPGLILDPLDSLLRITACVGAPGCAQAHAPTRPLARALAPLLPPGTSLHVSGCPKHCARPAHPATYTLTAGAQGFDLARKGIHLTRNSARTMPHEYETDGQAIYRQSFATIRAEADLARFTPEEERVAVRMIHAAGLVGLERDIRFTPDFTGAAIAALRAGAPILCDARMVSEGITRGRLPADNAVICTLHDPEVPMMARAMGNTRSAAALELWRPHLTGAVVAIGNAPTALFHLLNMLADPDCPRPAAIIGCPVGFVGAAESKAALIAAPPVPAMVVQGRLGGSAVTVAAINALGSDKE